MKRELAVKLHKEMWNWLSENPDQEKRHWPQWESNGGDVEKIDCDCFACEENAYGSNNCKDCMVDWGVNTCESPGSPFTKWDYSDNEDERAKYAAIIRDLPIKEL
jgi:hypothetical protein